MGYNPALVLASNSPRRKQMLALAGWTFEIRPAEIDESPWPQELPRQYVLRMAETKAREVAFQVKKKCVVIGADTIVVDGETILGKPSNALEARNMLLSLRNKVHQVFTAITVIKTDDFQLWKDICITAVPMRNYTDQELEDYIATGDPFDKAGAYAIQHPDFRPVPALSGCYATVVGLPLCHLTRTLAKVGIFPHTDVPRECMRTLQYNCDIYTQVLTGKY